MKDNSTNSVRAFIQFVKGGFKRSAISYGVAVAASVFGLLCNKFITFHAGPGLPTYVTFYPVVIITAIVAGMGPAIAATITSALLADYWLLPPIGQFGDNSLIDWIGISIFLTMGMLVSTVSEAYRQSRRKAAAYDKEQALRASEAALRQQREYLQVTLKSIGDAVIACDTTGHIAFLNSVASSLTGWPETEAIGQRFQDVFRIINEINRKPAQNIVEIVLREGRVVLLANHTALVTRDGRELPIEDSAAPIKDAAGNVIGVVLVFHDVTEKRKAQIAIEERERELTAIYENAPLIMLLVDGERRVCKMNKAAREFAGSDTKDPVGQRGGEALRCLHSLDDPQGCGFGPLCEQCTLRKTILDTFETGRSHHHVEAALPFSIEGKEQNLTFLVSTSRITVQGKHLVLVTIQDITDRKNAEEVVKQSKEHYQSLFQNMLEGFSLCKMIFDDQNRPVDFVYIEVNQSFEQLTGLKDVVGRKATELIPGIKEAHPEVLETYGRVAITGHPEIFEVHFRPLEKWFSISVYSPQREYFVAVFNDITERKIAQTAIEERENELTAIFENAPLMMLLVDKDRRIRKVNKAASQFTSTVNSDLIGLRDCEALKCMHALDESGGCGFGTFCQECTLRTTVLDTLETGRSHHQVEATLPFDVAGKQRYVTFLISTTRLKISGEYIALVTIHDITDRKFMEIELNKARVAAEEANHAKSDFLAKVSHEIRTPMTAVLGFTDLLRPTDLPEEERLSFLNTIEQSGGSLLTLIDDILNLSRIEEGMVPVNIAQISLREFVDELTMLAKGLAAKRNLTFVTTVAPSVPDNIATDRQKVRQVITNLIGNAFKYTEEGRVELKVSEITRDDKQLLQFAVTDTGRGIAADDLKKIFEPFYQTSNHTGTEGSGLGLAIASQLAKTLGGQLEVRSEQGKGSIFTLSLDLTPAVQEIPLPQVAPTIIVKEAISHQRRAQRLILYAEDDLNCQKLVQSALKRSGIGIHAAADGQIAYDMAIKSLVELNPYDLILTDIRMPRINGLELTKRLRKDGWRNPIIILTAHAAVIPRHEYKNAGCNDFMVKPFAPRQLLDIIAKHLPD